MGYGPVGVGEGGRRLLVLRAQATESLSGRAGRVAHALSSALSQGTHTGDAGHRSRSLRRPSFIGHQTEQQDELPAAYPAVQGRLRGGRGLMPVLGVDV